VVKALYHATQPTYVHQNIHWVKGDILDVIALEGIMKEVTQVYHCAAAVSFNPKNKNNYIKPI